MNIAQQQSTATAFSVYGSVRGPVPSSQSTGVSATDFNQPLPISRQNGIKNKLKYKGVVDPFDRLGQKKYKQAGDYSKAINFYQKSLEIKIDFGDCKIIASALKDLGNLY